jgi:hypothetical protein
MQLSRSEALVEEIARFVPDAYLTDGLSLFRVVSPLSSSGGQVTAELEDCLTLSTGSYTAEELWEMRLRFVSHGSRQ